MRSIGSGKPISTALPPIWIDHLVSNGVECNRFQCMALLYLTAIRQMAIGVVKYLFLAVQIKNPKYPNCPYVVFLNLNQKNMPIFGEKKSYNIISWYKESKIRKSYINKIWAQAKVNSEYTAPDDLIVSHFFFPRFSRFRDCLNYYFKTILALFTATIGVLSGKWWYGFNFSEAIYLHYATLLNREILAEEYFFHASSWYHKPMWTYEIEKKSSLITQYHYSTNTIEIDYTDHKSSNLWKLTKLWDRYIVWDKEQENYFKQFCPNASFTIVNYIDFSGSSLNFSPKGKKILSVFDVTPFRESFFTSLGHSISPYYSDELFITFFEDIIGVFGNGSWEILWKPKRTFLIPSNYISKKYQRNKSNFAEKYLTQVDPDIAARSLIEVSDAVISMPFSSPAIIAKIKGIPSIYYDASGLVRNKEHHGLPLLKSKNKLEEWAQSLVLVKNKKTLAV